MEPLVRHWPLFGLRVETPVLELRYATDGDLAVLAGLRDGQVLAPGEEPFDGDASFYQEPPRAMWRALLGEWGARARTSPEWWHLSFAAVVDGDVVGQQNITGESFSTLRTVNSFSFLRRDVRGRGLGGEMRAAVLHLAFAGLNAERAESDAFTDNVQSLGVSRSLGYVPNGTTLASRPSGTAVMQRMLLTRERWQVNARSDIALQGVREALPLLGLVPDVQEP